ncbi:Otopetrin domain containing protein [Aphelenchoides besseyi]|nr:Otopetrin domain containing protein [Aphelenchoides besseyi]KAI6210274.1 Otopetrin domain containing protein [Aphelenchoides besseyi]
MEELGKEIQVVSQQTQVISRSNSLASSNSGPKTEIAIAEEHPQPWVENIDAKNSLMTALTAFYAMVMTIFALVFELSHLLAAERKRTIHTKDLCFGIYMYGVSILFLFYCYVVLLLNPRWKVTILKWKTFIHFSGTESNESLDQSSYAAATIHRKVTHDSPSAGSLFLRLGAVVFGVIGTVYHAFNAFLCTGDDSCQALTVTMDLFSIVFIFTQMHFVFCNWKISITGSQTIARFGTMHLVAANIWTWIRYVLIEEGVMDREIKEIFSREGNENARQMFASASISITNHPTHTRYCEGAECILGSVSEIMYTSMVEYSLIGAAVMFIVWRNIDTVKVPTVYVKRKHQIRMDCSKTTSGLFFGLAFLAGTFTSMAVFYGYTIMGRNQIAAMVFGCTDIAQYLIASLGCVYALWQMRRLRYFGKLGSHLNRAHGNPNQELLDLILLTLGMSGEMLYSVAGLVGLSGDGNWHPLSIILFVVHVTRIAQVGVQSCLIYIAGKLRIQGDVELKRSQPGKQAITFLLIANIAMFLMNLLESEKAGVSEAVVNFYGKKSWVFLVRSFSPLTIFYRFHSSVCLAEVWKNAYAWKT